MPSWCVLWIMRLRPLLFNAIPYLCPERTRTASTPMADPSPIHSAYNHMEERSLAGAIYSGAFMSRVSQSKRTHYSAPEEGDSSGRKFRS